jgi:hypothetical protein
MIFTGKLVKVPGFTSEFKNAVVIHLTDAEVAQAIAEAMRLREESLQLNFQERMIASNKSPDQIQKEGALGEAAVRKAFKIKWYQPETPQWSGAPNKNPDVGNFEVRITPYDNGGLIVRPRDRINKPFILVVSKGSHDHMIIGWIHISNAKSNEFWRTDIPGPAAWFVPQTALNSIESLS